MRVLKYLSMTVLPLVFSCSPTVEAYRDNQKVIKNLSSCERVQGQLVPAVCGKCRLKYEGGKMYIIPAQDCPGYEVYRCTTKYGKVFIINNLKCLPVEEGG